MAFFLSALGLAAAAAALRTRPGRGDYSHTSTALRSNVEPADGRQAGRQDGSKISKGLKGPAGWDGEPGSLARGSVHNRALLPHLPS